MAQQQAIKLKIAGKSYSFTLKHEANEEQSLAEKEELYRLCLLYTSPSPRDA